MELDSSNESESDKDEHEINSLVSSLNLSKDEYDLDRAKEISKSLDGILPKNLFRLIIGYDGSSMRYLYGKVMDKLNPLREEERGLDFSNDNFLQNLAPIVKRESNKFPNYSIFWGDLASLLLKYIFHLKQKMINPSDEECERITNDIKTINSIIKEKFCLVVGNGFSFKTMNVDDFGSNFLNIEFLENSLYLSKEFIKTLEYTYPSLDFTFDEQKEKIRKFDCTKFKMKFFKDDNPNNVLLRLLMIRYDNKGKVIKECLKSDDQSSNQAAIKSFLSKSKLKELIEQINVDIHRLRSKGIKHFIEIPDMRYANSSMMNYILSNEIKVLIQMKGDLYWLFQKLKDVGLLNMGNFETIVKFRNNQNQEICEDYLKSFGKYPSKIEERNLVSEYLKSLKEKQSKKDSIECSLDDSKCLFSFIQNHF